MITRVVDGVTWTLDYNAENRTQSLGNGTYGASYLYDGDGARVGQLVMGAVQPDPAQPTEFTATYYFAGGAYEVTGALNDGTLTQPSTRKYYSIAGQMVAMDDSSKPDSGLNTS